MSHDSDCGHTDEEHEGMMKEMQERVLAGDLTPIIQNMPNEALIFNLEAVVQELFVRSQSDEEFVTNLRGLVQASEEVLVEGQDFPEIRETLLEERTLFVEKVKNDEFIREASGEIESMLDTYGMVTPPPPKDEGIGQYL